MAAAVPWRVICQQWGSKDKQIEAVVASCMGTVASKSCWEIQPINQYPNNLVGSNDPYFNNSLLDNFCTENCHNINADGVAAKYSNGTTYPTYLLVPFEGCGGNCVGSIPDCFNSCAGSDGNILNATSCDIGSCQGSACTPMKVLWDYGRWRWDTTTSLDFQRYSSPYAISEADDWGRNTSGMGHLNWCSGQNMHFDIGLTNPYWEAGGMGDIAVTNANSNILVRYKRVSCNVRGKFKPGP
jgi:hypothetical protein